MTEHYFSPHPTASDRRGEKTLTLQGIDYRVEVASGTFSAGGLDKGTAILLKSVPPPPTTGVMVDLGCGWGPITLALAAASPEATVFAVDVNQRALDLTAANATRAGLSNVTVITPEDFPDQPIDTLWSNPPIRIGKKALHELLTTWLHRLAPEGDAWLVVSKNLGAESLTAWLNSAHEGAFVAKRVTRDKGFHVLHVTRA